VPAAKYTEAQRAEALTLYENEGPSAVEKQLGIPKGTVTGWAKANGVQTVRNERTHEATVAAAEDNKLRRQRLIAKLYDRAEAVVDRLNAPTFRTLVPVAPGRQEPQDLDFVPPTEERALSGSIGGYLTSTANLEKVDAGNDTAATDSVVDQLLEGFKRQAGR
jgi:hypothetical protein